MKDDIIKNNKDPDKINIIIVYKVPRPNIFIKKTGPGNFYIFDNNNRNESWKKRTLKKIRKIIKDPNYDFNYHRNLSFYSEKAAMAFNVGLASGKWNQENYYAFKFKQSINKNRLG